MPWDVIAKIVLGGTVLFLFIWGWRLYGGERAARRAAEAERRAHDQADELEERASATLDGPERGDVGGLLDRWRRARRRRERLQQ